MLKDKLLSDLANVISNIREIACNTNDLDDEIIDIIKVIIKEYQGQDKDILDKAIEEFEQESKINLFCQKLLKCEYIDDYKNGTSKSTDDKLDRFYESLNEPSKSDYI